jgi:hypothetical protein
MGIITHEARGFFPARSLQRLLQIRELRKFKDEITARFMLVSVSSRRCVPGLSSLLLASFLPLPSFSSPCLFTFCLFSFTLLDFPLLNA